MIEAANADDSTQPPPLAQPRRPEGAMGHAAGRQSSRPVRKRPRKRPSLFNRRRAISMVTAEMLYGEAIEAKLPVSLSTIYNTLNQSPRAHEGDHASNGGDAEAAHHRRDRLPTVRARAGKPLLPGQQSSGGLRTPLRNKSSKTRPDSEFNPNGPCGPVLSRSRYRSVQLCSSAAACPDAFLQRRTRKFEESSEVPMD